MDVKSPEVTGSVKSVTIGRADSSNIGGTLQPIMAAAPVDDDGVSGDPTIPVVQSGIYQIGEVDIIAYQTDSLDFVELDAELVIEVLIGE